MTVVELIIQSVFNMIDGLIQSFAIWTSSPMQTKAVLYWRDRVDLIIFGQQRPSTIMDRHQASI